MVIFNARTYMMDLVVVAFIDQQHVEMVTLNVWYYNKIISIMGDQNVHYMVVCHIMVGILAIIQYNILNFEWVTLN